MIVEFKVKSMDDLIRRLNEHPNNFIFRGHADSSWKLESTIERVIGNNWTSEKAKTFEDRSINIFKSKYHIYNGSEHNPGTKLAWLSMLQHYGAPTRLLDFTESPYIALYFALEAYDPNSKKDLAIFALDYTGLMDVSVEHIAAKDSSFKAKRVELSEVPDKIFDEVVDRFSYDVVWVTEPQEMNLRLDRQAGTFLISGNRAKKIEDILGQEEYKDVSSVKYIIPKEFYPSIYALLRKMNINAKSIYGDLTGLAKTLKMEMQVYSS